ncbi:UDP-N-acetylmuramoyl-L-alanyl-D-glutamate--2,6-diaminopimelate ligase [Oceanobacillus bengalensis]|uniref:UDP-N-acetylmuramoyl-L-alanyl-D-glutamate--2,6-diaminopimelate ligase n=1 Tax=Oceanobacillus bengalensis TaxID=1435466 RepID=A0A494Z1F7_9BACI|nr:UDP-N-acetylmuramoyl-L-alanyl-D-glutamate--2,6-diaminopimelate ligase [Oceanobacillus bengalensis]RKQ16309.1 UDP-N-acetylmuramoyl-L-alanyl-D-glutamate--2,6-diaminopimelate ligase [Oceanobacillus bengalensis]
MKLQELLMSIAYHDVTTNIQDIVVSGIEMDSRKVKKGDVFVCISGFTTDGHQYVSDAEKNGAVAIISEKYIKTTVPLIKVQDTTRALAMLAVRFYNFPTKELSIIGVTGTNGKTTVTFLLEEIFRKYGKKTGVIGTIQMKIGDEIQQVENTTPNALDLQKSFRKMADADVELVMMEVSSHALDLGRVNGTEFDTAVFTNLSQDHLDYHHTLEEYLRAKSLLFSQLGNSYNRKKQRFAIINEDDSSSELLKKSTAQQVLTYACKQNADVEATDIRITTSGTSFLLKTPIGQTYVNSNLIGMFNVYNMLAAATAAMVQQVPLFIIKEALESITGVDGRFEVVDETLAYTVIVDYAHTPDSLENVLRTIKDFKANNIYVVVGCGGDRDRSKRPLMAAIALEYADYAIFTSDNPRTEDPEQVLQDMTDGLKADDPFEVIVDRKAAITKAIAYAKENDVVLIAGKGHETYQQIGTIKYDFDDRNVAKLAIKAKEQ